MPSPLNSPPEYDITIRVGCSLGYQVSGTASLLLNLGLRSDGAHEVLAEAITFGNNLKTEEFWDANGNRLRRVVLEPGLNFIRHDAIVAVSSQPENQGFFGPPVAAERLPVELLKYTSPSRYCDSDKLSDFAWQKFGQIEHGLPRVTAISQWLHDNIEYRYMSGRADISAWDVLQRGYGVCRDFAHLAVALNRSFNLPARYVTGHLPDIAFPVGDAPADFHAYGEVFVGGHWYTTDARFHVPRIGRVKMACGMDAVDCAFSTIFGGASLSNFTVWAYQVPRGAVGVGDPIDLSLRLDNQWTIRRDLG